VSSETSFKARTYMVRGTLFFATIKLEN
jgi:hypothetical protein